jgi:FtsP/CotA-like multicopper oxidase with cupredoxin domain
MTRQRSQRLRRNTRTVVALVATMLLVVPLGFMWWSSRVPSNYSAMGMGYADFGGGPADPVHMHHAAFGWDGPPIQPGDVSVADLTGPTDGAPDLAVELVARADEDGLAQYTLNGSSPGPEIRVQEGELVEVTLVNESVPDGTTLHWHGVPVPNAEDGVAGVTQDAVPAGGSHTYRFVANQPGTYWYHSHQVSHRQVRGGLFGTLVVEPDGGLDVDLDVVAAVHTYGRISTVGGMPDRQHVHASEGDAVRVRVINTDDSVHRAWVTTPYRIAAVDAREVNEPGEVDGDAVLVAAGGRVDVEFTVPEDGSSVHVHVGAVALTVGPVDQTVDAISQPTDLVDLLHYGKPDELDFDPRHPDRTFEYRIGRRPGMLDGRPGMFWTINGRMYPDIPMFVVSEGDVVAMTIVNSRADNHPMHLHGHHALVLARNGVPASGSPWWTDSLEVGPGDTYDIAFVADNPGIWMDHCHDLGHAADGLVAHIAYTGVHTPYRIGGDARNEPE